MSPEAAIGRIVVARFIGSSKEALPLERKNGELHLKCVAREEVCACVIQVLREGVPLMEVYPHLGVIQAHM